MQMDVHVTELSRLSYANEHASWTPYRVKTRLEHLTAQSSTSIFTKMRLVCFRLNFSNTGAIILHGPHHVAVKSATTYGTCMYVWSDAHGGYWRYPRYA